MIEQKTDQELVRFIDERCEEMVALLERLVNTDSGTYHKPGTDAIGRILAEQVRALGFEVEVVPRPEYGDHLVCRKPGTSPRLLFLAHMDTVFGADTTRERPFTRRDGRAHGPGALDMKSGIVCLLSALEALRAADRTAYDAADLAIVFNSEEEILSPTSRPIIEEQARQAAIVCVLEPARPDGEYVTRRKGAGKFWLEIEGRSAHAGVQPELGASAIHALGAKIVELAALTNFDTGTTVNVGVVRGGTRSNVVAERAEAEIDLRAWSSEEAERTIAAMHAIAEREHVPGTRGRLRGGLDFPPMERTEAIAALFARVQAAGRRLGLELAETSTGGGSDGNHAARFAPVVDGMGPKGTGAHSPDEFVELATLPERAKVLALFVADWLARPEMGDGCRMRCHSTNPRPGAGPSG